jgi:predicted RND superfamily exporter protein
MLELTQDMSILAIIFAVVGFFWVSFKNWWSGRVVNQLTEEDRKLFKEVDAIKDSISDRQTEIDSISKEETDKELGEAVDEWNKKS